MEQNKILLSQRAFMYLVWRDHSITSSPNCIKIFHFSGGKAEPSPDSIMLPKVELKPLATCGTWVRSWRMSWQSISSFPAVKPPLVVLKRDFFSSDTIWNHPFLCRYSWKVTVLPGWCRAEGAQQTTPGRFSRSTLRRECAACQKSMASARRQCWALGWQSLMLFTVGRRIPGSNRPGWQQVLPQSSFSARSSSMRCSRTFWGSRNLSISFCTMHVR